MGCSGIGNRESGVGNREAGHGSRESGFGLGSAGLGGLGLDAAASRANPPCPTFQKGGARGRVRRCRSLSRFKETAGPLPPLTKGASARRIVPKATNLQRGGFAVARPIAC